MDTIQGSKVYATLFRNECFDYPKGIMLPADEIPEVVVERDGMFLYIQGEFYGENRTIIEPLSNMAVFPSGVLETPDGTLENFEEER